MTINVIQFVEGKIEINCFVDNDFCIFDGYMR